MSNIARQVEVNGTTLAYYESGSGEPVVFIHGAISDHRYWRSQVEVLSRRYRCVALDQRYFGQSWTTGGREYSLATHADDLCQFICALSSEPVHVVATSYGSGVALASAVASPRCLRSLLLNEPVLASLVTEPNGRAVLSRERAELAAAAAAVAANDFAKAAELFCDWTAFPGAFSSSTEEFKTMLYENARTLPLHFASPRSVTPALDLAQVRVPVTFTVGEKTRQFFVVQAEAAHRAIAHSRLTRIPGAYHIANLECPEAFNAVLAEHLAQAAAA